MAFARSRLPLLRGLVRVLPRPRDGLARVKRSPLKRKSRLRSRPSESFEQRVMKQLKRRPPVKHEPGAGDLVWRRDLGDCIVCPYEAREAGAVCSCASEPKSHCMVHGVCRGPVQGHHAVEKQALKRRGLHRYLDDVRNRVPVCEHRHEQHTSRVKPIPRGALPASVFEFAADLGLAWWVDRFYPGEDLAA